MSLGRKSVQESKEYLRDNCTAIFGQKFFECRLISSCQLAAKADKFEPRFVAISKFRVFVVNGKNVTNFKLERSFNLLSIRSLIVSDKELIFSFEDKPKNLCKYVYRSEDVSPMDMGKELLAALKHYFPDIGPSLLKLLQIQPEKLLTDFPSLPTSQPELPCHNFRRSYVVVCDYIDHPFKEEVFWDVERIYFTNHIREIRLEDFSHLAVKDQVAIFHCAQFSSYFTGILVDGIRLQPEHVDAVLSVVRRSNSLKSLKLLNCGLLKDFLVSLSAALSANLTVPLSVLDLSGNQLEDKKNISHLAAVLPKVHSLKSISFADCGLSEKSVHHLAAGLNTGLTMDSNVGGQRFELRRLVLSRCSLRDEANELVSFVSVCGSLRSLDLSGTGILVDRLWPVLKFGGLQLEYLNLSGCQSSKKTKESAAAAKELFSCMVNLEELNLSNTPLHSDVLHSILYGLANNSQLSNIRLNLDGCCSADRQCFGVLEQLIGRCPIGYLSLRDNALEQDAQRVFAALRTSKTLRSLDLGGANLINLKTNKKYSSIMTNVLTELVKLVSSEEATLKELILSDCRLGNMLSVLFNALSLATIERLDIANNEIGNFGARLLSKALQLNTSISVLAFDRNQISAEGFVEIAHALRLNHSLTTIPYPTIDIAEALARPDRSRVLSAVAEIERALERNRSERRVFDWCSQKLIHSLNNYCDRYGVNGSNAKKVIFHKLITVITETSAESALSVSAYGLVESFLSNLSVLAKDNDQRFLAAIQKSLAEQNVEMSETATVDKEETADQQLRAKLRTAVDNYLTESAFDSAYSQLDRLLAQPDGLKLRGSFSTSAIDNSVHMSQFSSRTNTGAHRPNSMVAAAAAAAEENGNRNGVHSPEVASPLIHLVKSRPPPPRNLKNVKANAQNGDTNSLMSCSVHSSATNSSAEPTPPSPRVRTSLQTAPPPPPPSTGETNDETAPPPLPQSTPPPLIPRRGFRLPTPNQPPRLPPKPGGGWESPVDLRNHKTKVLPSLEMARELFKDSSDDSA